VRIQITLYYPAPLALSEASSLLGDERQSKAETVDEPTIQIEQTSSPSVVDPPSQHQPPSALGEPSPSALDRGPPQVPAAAGSAVSLASTARPRPTGKRPAGKKARGGGTGAGATGGGGAGGGEEQVFHYVVERFDDDVRDDSAASPGVVEAQSKDDRKPPGKKKGHHEGQAAAERPTDDVGAARAPMSDSQLRRIAAERLWNVTRSPGARHTFERLNR